VLWRGGQQHGPCTPDAAPWLKLVWRSDAAVLLWDSSSKSSHERSNDRMLAVTLRPSSHQQRSTLHHS
jgi:hypothetical protein